MEIIFLCVNVVGMETPDRGINSRTVHLIHLFTYPSTHSSIQYLISASHHVLRNFVCLLVVIKLLPFIDLIQILNICNHRGLNILCFLLYSGLCWVFYRFLLYGGFYYTVVRPVSPKIFVKFFSTKRQLQAV